MAKKLNSGKSTPRHQKSARRQKNDKNTSGQGTPDERKVDRGPTRAEEEPVNQGLPEAHYYGERKSPAAGNPEDTAGSLNEETLDKDAPYNRTYGRENS